MTSVKELAHAKINLFLDILSKRDDGFHDIKTVMHTVSLADEVTVSVASSDRPSVKITNVSGVKLPIDNRNLAYRAAEFFLERTMIQASVTITLKKMIPVAAGLAGGSSDAAAVLRALNRLFKRPLTDKYLLSLATELGSDVPFCLIGGTVLCTGRGEELTRLPKAEIEHMVIAVADEHVSTPWAYARLDEIYEDFKFSRSDKTDEHYADLMRRIENKDFTEFKLYNIFENAVFSTCIGAESIKGALLQLGATNAMMSGSGPSVFGIFKSKMLCDKAIASLSQRGISAWYVTSV